MFVCILRKQTDGPEKSGQVMGVSLYSDPVEDQSLCCDKGILSKAFSTRKKYLIVKIRSQDKNQCARGPRQKLFTTYTQHLSFFLPKCVFVRGLWCHFLPQKQKRKRMIQSNFWHQTDMCGSNTPLTPVPGEV